MVASEIVYLRNGETNVRRVKRVIPNEGASTYTLVFDSVHDDTDPTGSPLGDRAEAADHPRQMPETLDKTVTVGNRATYSEKELSAAGFFDVYNSLHKGQHIGPKKAAPEKPETPPAK